jgi:hypothetical protein
MPNAPAKTKPAGCTDDLGSFGVIFGGLQISASSSLLSAGIFATAKRFYGVEPNLMAHNENAYAGTVDDRISEGYFGAPKWLIHLSSAMLNNDNEREQQIRCRRCEPQLDAAAVKI